MSDKDRHTLVEYVTYSKDRKGRKSAFLEKIILKQSHLPTVADLPVMEPFGIEIPAVN